MDHLDVTREDYLALRRSLIDAANDLMFVPSEGSSDALAEILSFLRGHCAECAFELTPKDQRRGTCSICGTPIAWVFS